MFHERLPVERTLRLERLHRHKLVGVQQVEVLDEGGCRHVQKEGVQGKLGPLGGGLDVQAGEQVQDAAVHKAEPGLQKVLLDSDFDHLGAVIQALRKKAHTLVNF